MMTSAAMRWIVCLPMRLMRRTRLCVRSSPQARMRSSTALAGLLGAGGLYAFRNRPAV